MNLPAQKILKLGNFIVYCLSAHTRGKTQPLYVGLYGPFKVFFRSKIRKAIQMYDEPDFEQFDFLNRMRVAYKKLFTSINVVRAFSISGLFPVCSSKLIGDPIPRSSNLHFYHE